MALLLLVLGCGRIGFAARPAAPAGRDDDAGAPAEDCPAAVDRSDADGDGFLDACDPCGDGVLDTAAGETCDPGAPDAPCPANCDDHEPCTKDTQSGSLQGCNVVCTNVLIADAFNEDSCCPPGANNTNDSDCVPVCGNGATEAGERCDPGSEASACPSSCDDGSGCTEDDRTGSDANCDVECTHTEITTLVAGDQCCPPGANNATDADCSPACGNGTIESGELCDPPSSCPTDCDDGDACTTDSIRGMPQNCDVACDHMDVTLPFNGDACCPPGANNTNDSDCAPICGNGVVEASEQCDGGTGCSASCTLTNEGRCLALLAPLPQSGLGADACRSCACSRCSAQMLDCYVNGSSSRDRNCKPVVECATEESCSGDCSSDFGCYGEFCWWGGNYPRNANGPCKNEISSAAGGSTDPATIQSRASNSSYPLYWAERFGSCLSSRCSTACGL